jgi:dCTP deaminase
MIIPAQTIRSLCKSANPLVKPFHERKAFEGCTFGLSPAGYDVRIAQDIWIWPFWGKLASTIEEFEIPYDIVARVCDKSTWARRFVLVQNTVIEPGWRGFLTLEITRCVPWPIKIKRGSPIAQILFERLENPTEQPYSGKYQDQCPNPQRAITQTPC